MRPFDLRPVRAHDLDAIRRLVNRSEAHDRIPRVLSLAELRGDLDAPYVDLDLDTRAAVRDGAIVGWAWVWNPPVEERQERAYLYGEVDPEHRGTGIGRALVGWSLGRVEERFQQHHNGLPKFVRVAAYDWMAANERLYSRFGFAAVRWFEELVRPLDDLPEVATVPGVVLLPWPDDRSDEILAARNDAFADHWGSAPVDPDGWQPMVAGHGTRLDLSVVAVDVDSGEIVGLCLNHAYPEDEAVTGRKDAWIENLATRKPWRGRGLASAMIAWSLRAFVADGATHAMIGVDADNTTGAARLYRNLGFEPLLRSVTYERPG